MKKSYCIGAIFLILALVMGGFAVCEYQEEKNAGREYEELKKAVVKEDREEEPLKEDEVSVKIPIDFSALHEINPDIYAWIRIPGTEIDYPVVQSPTDNTYYVRRTVSGEKKTEGSIFTENYNSTEFDDPNTVVYGHNMRNGSMFRSLHRYTDREFFDENREILIYLPDRILHYQIFAAYLYDDRHLLRSFDFDDKEVYRKYLESIFSMRDMQAFVDKDIKVTAEDKIVTLSTCYSGQPDRRYLVQGVLQNVEQ